MLYIIMSMDHVCLALILLVLFGRIVLCSHQVHFPSCTLRVLLLLCELLTAGEKYSKVVKPDFPGGAVVKNPPATAGDTGLSPGLGRSYMPPSN